MIQTSRIISAFCVFIILANCKKEIETKISFEERKFPIIIDDMTGQKAELASADWLGYAHNQAFYFGEFLDTIKVNRKTDFKSEYFASEYPYTNILTMDSAKVEIKVDKSQTINTLGLKSNPVLIYNKSIDTLFIGTDGGIYFITEGKTKTGEWKPIEKHYFPFCATGVVSTILPPNKVVLSSVVNYSGDYNTKLRIKMGSNYSNEYDGWINESQFESAKE